MSRIREIIFRFDAGFIVLDLESLDFEFDVIVKRGFRIDFFGEGGVYFVCGGRVI